MQRVKARVELGVQVRVKVGDYAENKSETRMKSESEYMQQVKVRV